MKVCKRGEGRLRSRRAPTYRKISGDNSERDPPVPIPNTEVKPLSADGTWLATARESRTSPGSRERKLEERKLLQHAYNGENAREGHEGMESERGKPEQKGPGQGNEQKDLSEGTEQGTRARTLNQNQTIDNPQ